MSVSSIDAKLELKSELKSDAHCGAVAANSLDNFLSQSGGAAQHPTSEDALLFSFADAPKNPTSASPTIPASPLTRENTPPNSPPNTPPETVVLDAQTATHANSQDGTSSTRSAADNAADNASSGIAVPSEVRREPAVTTTVYLALGSNLGDRLTNLREAVARLERHPNFEVAGKSRVYETESVEGGGEAPYLNAVVRGAWTGSAMSLLRCVQGVEERMGRPRPPRRGPRIIDVDILLFGESKIENANLVVPHPRMMQRAFVLRPLCDVLENGWVREFALGSL